MKSHNLQENIPTDLPEELIETLVSSAHVRIERIVSHGHVTADAAWYDQAEDEFVLLVSGQARLEFSAPQRLVSLSPGDWLLIPAHERHRVSWTHPTQNTVWLAVFLTR